MADFELAKGLTLDDITGVYTRGDIMNMIDTFLQGEGKNGIHALIMLDVDNFKQVNDSLGHLSGDQVIRSVAQKIISFFHDDAFVGRIGGDEFFILMTNTSVQLAEQRVSRMLNDMRFLLANNGTSMLVTSSCGIAMYDGTDEEPKTLKDLYAEADAALYKAKHSGKNTFAFANIKGDSSFDQMSKPRHESDLMSLNNILNDIGVSVLVFKGSSPDELIPVYCNTAYTKLSGLTGEDFRRTLAKDNLYGVHPDDIAEARREFAKLYNTNKPINHHLRVLKPNGKYEWVSMLANIKFLDAERFEVYLVFLDAEEHMYEKQLKEQRFHNLIEKSINDTDKSLFTICMSLTNDCCNVVQYSIEANHIPNFDGSVDDFIIGTSKNIASEMLQQKYVQTFCREALIMSFENGVLSPSLDIPMRLADGRIIWCEQKADLTRKPNSEEIECVIRLIEDDHNIRIQKSFKRIMQTDYEHVANVNVETGIVTVLSERNDHGLASVKDNDLVYEDLCEQRMRMLVKPEFADDCIQTVKLKRIISELKKSSSFVCTFPANSKTLGHEGVFQWRYSYVDDAKTDIVFSRVEMISFLDNRQKVHLSEDDITLAETVKIVPAKDNYILIADDVEINRDMLRIIFEEDYGIIEAADGEEAIRLIDENHERLALILLDMQMPKKTGLDVLIHMNLRGLIEHIPVMLVTSFASGELNLHVLEYGVADIIMKPFDRKIVRRRALNLMKLYTHQHDIEHQLDAWKQEAIRMQARTRHNDELLINTLSSVVEFRSQESGQHINRVRALTEIMLKMWGLIDPKRRFSSAEIEEISRAAAMHDIGKVAIPDSILNKPGRLTAEEFDIMKTHTTVGCKILERFKQEDSNFYTYCYDICRYHHEREDGRGYPDGLVGDQIPIWAQIVSVVDVFDALTSVRVYKPAFTIEKAIAMIMNGECGNFSQKLLKCFALAKDEIAVLYRATQDMQSNGKEH